MSSPVQVSIENPSEEIKRPKSRKMNLAQHGHSYLENAIYNFLWKTNIGNAPQVASGGYNRIGRKLGHDGKTVKRALLSLEKKLTIERIPNSYEPKTQEPTKYRVYSFVDILARRKGVGLNGYIRNRGGVTLTCLHIAATTPAIEPSSGPADEHSSGPPSADWYSREFRKAQLRTYLTQNFTNPTAPDDEVLNPLAQLIATETLFEQFRAASEGFRPKKGWKGFLTIASRCSEHSDDYEKARVASANDQHQANSKLDPSEEYARRVREKEKNRE